MADKISNYLTGNDTTGAGTVANPYKTLAKSLSVMAAGDRALFQEDEPLSAELTIPTFTDYTKISIIAACNAAGVIDGTRKALYPATTQNYCFANVSANTYVWAIHNIQFGKVIAGKYQSFAEMPFQATTAWVGVDVYGCLLLGGKGFGKDSNFRPYMLVDCTAVDCAGTTVGPFQIYNATMRRCRAISCVVTSGNIFGSTSGQVLDCVAYNCQASASIVGTALLIKNVIIDKCIVTSAATNSPMAMAATCYAENVLITRCVGNNGSTYSALAYSAGAQRQWIRNLAWWQKTNITNVVQKGATGSLYMSNVNLTELSESPYLNDPDTTQDWTLKPTFAWRRFPIKLGESTYEWSAL